jgi:ubiquinone/menaquinone biosynthesis C-methylase UbiE
MRIINKVQALLKSIFLTSKKYNSQIEYWEERANKFGAKSVIHLGHSDEEYDNITKYQIDFLFPIYKDLLSGNESLILDFGCGPGRFTKELSKISNTKVIGIDPIQKLLDLAPKSENVDYMLMEQGVIPLNNNSVDSIWICLVFGSITDSEVFNNTINELNRVLKNKGTLFLVEKTSQDLSNKQTKNAGFYEKKFDFVNLKKVADYNDINDCNSVFIGVK